MGGPLAPGLGLPQIGITGLETVTVHFLGSDKLAAARFLPVDPLAIAAL